MAFKIVMIGIWLGLNPRGIFLVFFKEPISANLEYYRLIVNQSEHNVILNVFGECDSRI